MTGLESSQTDVPAVIDGRILGHEAVGTVERVGSGVKRIRVGDRVLVSCITACGSCRFCREARYGQCTGGGGWILGHKIDGTQAEYVRVPFADTSTHLAPKQFGADVTVNNDVQDPAAVVAELTEGLGADVTIEAVGVPSTFELATSLVRPGGHVANVGVHGEPASLHLERLWIRDVTITTGLVDTYSTPTLLKLVGSRQVDVGRFSTHRFDLDEFIDAYSVFGRAAQTGALKVVLARS